MTQISSLQCHQTWLAGKSTIKWRFIYSIYIYYIFYIYMVGFRGTPLRNHSTGGQLEPPADVWAKTQSAKDTGSSAPVAVGGIDRLPMFQGFRLIGTPRICFSICFNIPLETLAFYWIYSLCCPLLGSIEYINSRMGLSSSLR